MTMIYILVSIFTFTYIYTNHLSPLSRGLSRLKVLIWNAWPRCLGVDFREKGKAIINEESEHQGIIVSNPIIIVIVS